MQVQVLLQKIVKLQKKLHQRQAQNQAQSQVSAVVGRNLLQQRLANSKNLTKRKLTSRCGFFILYNLPILLEMAQSS